MVPICFTTGAYNLIEDICKARGATPTDFSSRCQINLSGSVNRFTLCTFGSTSKRAITIVVGSRCAKGTVTDVKLLKGKRAFVDLDIVNGDAAALRSLVSAAEVSILGPTIFPP